MAKRPKADEPETMRALDPSGEPDLAEPQITAAADQARDQAAVEPPARSAQTLVTVKFIGPGQAVLGTGLILHGETRSQVTLAMLDRAEQHHPGEFIIVED